MIYFSTILGRWEKGCQKRIINKIEAMFTTGHVVGNVKYPFTVTCIVGSNNVSINFLQIFFLSFEGEFKFFPLNVERTNLET